MKITEENINQLPLEDKNLGRLKALYQDLCEINALNVKQIYFRFIDEHTEWNPERTDPCPDYYGMFQIIDSKTGESIGVEMTLDELDTTMCALYNYVID